MGDFQKLRMLSVDPEVIEKIMGDIFIEGLVMEDHVKILLLSLKSRDISGLFERMDVVSNRQAMLKRVRKCLNILKNTRETLIHAHVYFRIAYYLQWEGGDVNARTRLDMQERSYAILLKHYPHILSMEPSEYATIPPFEALSINMVFEGRILSYSLVDASEKTLPCEEIKKEFVEICDFYERLLQTNKFINKEQRLVLKAIFIDILEHAETFFQNVSEKEKSLESRKRATALRQSIFQSCQELSSFPCRNQLMELYERNKLMRDAETQMKRIPALLELGKIDEARDQILDLSTKKDIFDQWMCVSFQNIKVRYFKKTGDYVRYFNGVNKAIELHLEAYGWTSIFTLETVMGRIELLLLVGEKEKAMKDLKRMKKHSSFFNNRIRELYKEYEEVAISPDLVMIIPDDLKPNYNKLKKYIQSKKKKEKKELKYQNNRNCSNDHCSKSETQERRFKVCSACKVALYCSRKCQVEHWKHHKKECKSWEKKRK